MFSKFDDLCPFKALLYVNGENFDFEKHVLNLLTNAESAEWRRITTNHLKWKYIDTLSGVQETSILFVLEKLLKKYWPDQHQEALKRTLDRILHKLRVVEFSSKSLLVIISHHHTSILTTELSSKCKRDTCHQRT